MQASAPRRECLGAATSRTVNRDGTAPIVSATEGASYRERPSTVRIAKIQPEVEGPHSRCNESRALDPYRVTWSTTRRVIAAAKLTKAARSCTYPCLPGAALVAFAMLAIGRAEHDVHRDEESIVGPSSLLYPPATGKTGGASYGWHGRSGRSGEASLETEAARGTGAWLVRNQGAAPEWRHPARVIGPSGSSGQKVARAAAAPHSTASG